MAALDMDQVILKLRERLRADGPGNTRLVLRIVRAVAQGRPITPAEVDGHIAALGLAHDTADRFLREVTERDAADRIIGVMGLSQADHPHRITVAGVPLSAWCALDTLFLPALLGQPATIESPAPGTRELVRLRVTPERVEAVSPAGAAMTFVLVDLDQDAMRSVEAVWMAFCTHVHFFPSRTAAERWAAGRDDIVVLTVDEAFALGRDVWGTLPDQAA
ncbi:MAG TPA: organomercurial lyase [Ktedonobacterales bacterium]|nr:organomercurial lyase [Ktedonobacterales bacterium]